MPIKKLRLNRAEQAEYRLAAQQLQEQGLIRKLPQWLKSAPAVDILSNEMASDVAELPSGQAYYSVWVQLVAREAGITLVDCKITTDWDDQIVLGSDEVNLLCGPRGPACAPDGVLNARIEKSIRFRRRGDMIRGTVFAWGLRPIPDAYRTGARVPFELAFTDSLGDQLDTEGTLSVIRRRTRGTPIPKQSLFDGLVVNRESFEERDRRAYLRTLEKEQSNSPESDPDREVALQIWRNRQFWRAWRSSVPPPLIK